MTAVNKSHNPANQFDVDLPSGGTLHLQTIDEVTLWEETGKRYIEDYGLAQQNDLMLLGAILTQQLMMFRAQQRASGMEPEFDANKLPTGRYVKATIKASDLTAAQGIITKCASEIRDLEKALGVDKKSRDSGGQVTVTAYVNALKEAARTYSLHIVKRTKEYEQFCMDLRWKLRLLRNGDTEDRAYHGITEKNIIEWCEQEVARLEDVDKLHAKEVGKIYMGRVR